MKRFFSICLAAALLAVPLSASAQSAQEVMARFSHEPTIDETLNAAFEYAGLNGDRLESMYTRAGAANALPKVLSYELTYKDQDKDRPQGVMTFEDGKDDEWKSYKATEYKESQVYLQHKVKAQWDLSKVVYNSDQTRVVSAMTSSVEKREKLQKSISKAYFARRKLQIDMLLNPPDSTEEILKKQLQIDEHTATLNALTGGWFVKNLKK